MAKRDPNRIQVDLRLLQDKNLRELRKFGDQFERSVDRLSKTLAKGGGFGGGGGQFGTTARGSGNQPGGGSSQAPPPPGGGHARQPGANPPGQPQGANWFARQGYGNPNIEAFERAQFNLGNIGEMDAMAQLRYLSHILQKPGYDAEGNAPPEAWRTAFRNVGGVAGLIPRANTYFQSARGVIAHIANAGLGPTSFGQNIGLSRQGGYVAGHLGLPFFSPAWNVGFGANLRSNVRSWFGFNPNYSTAQAKEAMGLVNQYGYDGHLANYMLDRMKNITETTGLDASTQMQLLDPAMRFGTDSMQGVVDALYQMPGAARAARMGLSQFSADLLSAAQSLAESTSMTMGGAARSLTAFSAATGLAPQKGASILGDTQNMFMTMGLTGQSPYQLMFGSHGGSARTQTAIHMAESVTGVPMNQWDRLKRSNPAAFDAMMSRLIVVQQQNPELFGNLNVKDLVNLANQKTPIDRMRALETLQRVGSMKAAPNWNALLRQMGFSQDGRSAFYAYQQKLADQGITGREAMLRERDWMVKHLDDVLRKSHEAARGKTYFDLSPEAKRLVRYMDKTYPKATSNSGGDATAYASPAIEHEASRFRR